MRIVASRIERIGGNVGRNVGAAGAGVSAREGVLLTLTSDAGVSGIGEASPLPGYSPDSLSDAWEALDGIDCEIAGLHPDRGGVAAVTRALSPAAATLARSPSARFAVETALFDLLGRSIGTSVHRLLGGAPRLSPRAGLLAAPLDASAVDAARALAARGIRTVKAKVGGPAGLDDEVAILGAVRRAVPGLALRLDANGAWEQDAAREAMKRLSPLAPEYVEEPCHGQALVGLGVCAVPWAADESMRDANVAERLLSAPGLGAVVLKPALLGGLLRARELALAAQARGRRAVVTHLFDGPIALAAAAELALSLPPDAHGLDPHPALAAFPRLEVPQVGSLAEITPAPGPGLGLEAAHADAEAMWKP